MPIDLRRFRRDLASLRSEAVADPNHAGRRSTGAMATIRALRPELERQHAAGFTWPEIATALAAQGVKQILDRRQVAITGRRVSALLASVRRQDERRQTVARQRTNRDDRPRQVDAAVEVVVAAQANGPRKLRISTDLSAAEVPPAANQGPIITEEALRRAALANAQPLLKKGS